VKVSEYTLMRMAWEQSFGFMLNRLAEADWLKVDDHHDSKHTTQRDHLEDQCWNEFLLALDDIGLEFGEMHSVRVEDSSDEA
jgi:hypothetical protein